MQDPPVAAIDLGTKSVLMVIGQRTEQGIRIITDEHAIVGLGEGVDAQGSLSQEAMDRACHQITVYSEIALRLGVQTIAAWGTSALRDAVNRQLLIERVFKENRINLRPLSGEQEALLTFRGAQFGKNDLEHCAVIDIGGGSTEIALGSPSHLQFSLSLDMGSVRLSERFFCQLPPKPKALAQARNQIETALGTLPPINPDLPIIAVSGTPLVLAALDKGKDRFNEPSLDGHYLNTERIRQMSTELLGMDYPSLCSLSPIGSERADGIGAGGLILSTFLERCGLHGVCVSLRGLRYGLLERMVQASEESTA